MTYEQRAKIVYFTLIAFFVLALILLTIFSSCKPEPEPEKMTAEERKETQQKDQDQREQVIYPQNEGGE